ALAKIESDGRPLGPAEFSFRHKNGNTGVVLSTVFQMQAAAREPRFVCMDVDLTRRKQAESLTAAQMQVLEMIARGEPMAKTLDTLLRLVESQSPSMVCSILLLDPDGVHVRHGAAPSLPPEYMRAIDDQPIGPKAGSCGTAMFRRQSVFVSDIANDPLWEEYREFALPHNLRACWSTPIIDSQRRVLGSFAIYYRHPGLPDEYHIQLIAMATHTAAVCLGKQRAETDREEAIAREHQSRIRYTLQLIAAQEAERKRIAAELHDSLGQNLLLVKNLAQMAMRQQEPAAAYEQLGNINNLAAQCIAEVRQISRDLHPPQLELLGLKRSLEILLENTAGASDKKFKWKFDDTGKIFPADAAMNLYRIVQESLNNILKHSRAQNVRVTLECDVHEVQLVIADDGCGFNPGKNASVKRGMGLQNIAERVRMLGGKYTLDSAPENGTRLTVVIPVADPSG
ncbi:MAG TPA: GAF domain-containing sensor histidine kinase, partial [Candidatus Sulfotelmatobacter sp.]|nr:GAF domain-containing sensor histidine kinase [Candidatus Sulfotelmatobacter sp.]